MTKLYLLTLGASLCAFITHANQAFAQSNAIYSHEEYSQALFIPSVYTIDDSWNTQNYDFTAPATVPIITGSTDALDVTAANTAAYKPYKDKGDVADEILGNLPYKNTLKYTWNVIDGDVDLHFEGLRVDRNNRGVSYKTQSLPYFGEVEGLKIKAELGKDQKLGFESDYLPLIGRVEGLKFKASVSNDSEISLRYKKSFP